MKHEEFKDHVAKLGKLYNLLFSCFDDFFEIAF